MKIFENFNEAGICPICKTKKKGKTVLVAIDGTRDGNNEEAHQVHLDCLNLRYVKSDYGELVYQKIR